MIVKSVTARGSATTVSSEDVMKVLGSWVVKMPPIMTVSFPLAVIAVTLRVKVEVALVVSGFEKSTCVTEREAMGNMDFPVTVTTRDTVGLVVVLNWLTEVRVRTSVVDDARPWRNWPRLFFAGLMVAYGRVARILLSKAPL